MGLIRRVLLIMRGYLNAAGDTLDRAAEEEARREARARKEALEELGGAGRAAGSTSSAAQERTGGIGPTSSAIASDYAVLGLRPDAELSAVEATWRELARRADPKRFPPGSEEEKKAAELLGRINESYARIREHVNPTEARFGRLEL